MGRKSKDEVKDHMFNRRKSRAEGLVTSLLAGMIVAPLAAAGKIADTSKDAAQPMNSVAEAVLCLVLGLVLLVLAVAAILYVPIFGDVLAVVLLLFGFSGCYVGVETMVRLRRSRKGRDCADTE